jgi:hypothetical protein
VGILGNFVRENQSALRCYGGGAVSLSRGNLSTNRKSLWRHFIIRDGESSARATVGKPHGYYPMASWRLPMQGGAVIGFAEMGIAASGEPAIGSAISGSASMLIDGSAVGNLVVSAIGVATMTIDASGSISGVANGSGSASMTIDAAATPGAIGYLSGDAPISVSGYADCYGIGYCTGTTAEVVALSPEALAAAVWGSDAATFNAAGTMGSKLNAASSAGDPWSTALPGSYPAGSAGAIMGSYLADLWRRFGLGETQVTSKSGTVTTITDGSLTLLVTEQPDGSVTVDRQ